METGNLNNPYTVSYFIKKFEAIPEEKWCTDALRDELDTKRCALGHCCGYLKERYFDSDASKTHESNSLDKLFTKTINAHVALVNDGCLNDYPQPTPKQRILAALYDIKANEAVKEAQTIISTEPQAA